MSTVDENMPSNVEDVHTSAAHPNAVGSDSGHSGPSSLTLFPALTGLRPRVTDGRGSVKLDTRLKSRDLYGFTDSLGVQPVAPLQLTWALILSAYTSAPEVSFATKTVRIVPHHSNDCDDETVFDAHTRFSPAAAGEKPPRFVLQELAGSNHSSFISNQAYNGTPDWDDDCQSASRITFINEPYSETHSSSSPLVFQYGVDLVLRPTAAGLLTLEASYIDQLLNQSSALVMMRQIEDMMALILTDPNQSVDISPWATRASLLSTSNEKMVESGDTIEDFQGLHSQFEQYARRSPDREALVFKQSLDTSKSHEDVSWTYRRLDQKAQMLADDLRDRFGQLVDMVVPICMNRRPELYVAILGILKAGGAWCPIDPSFPGRRRHDLIARTCTKVMMVAEEEIVEDKVGIPEGITIIDITQLGKTSPSPCQTLKPNPSSLAYLVWTSGTTGDPKGVPISHGAAVASMKAIQKSIPTDVEGGIVRCLQFSQFTFDVFVQDLFYTWGIGGTLIASGRALMLGSFAQLATETRATHAHLTPAFAASVERKHCPTLQVVTMIGEKLTQVVADDWGQDIRSFNTYGPAETTVVSTFRQFGSVGDEIQSHNIGYPLSSVSAFVMRNQQPVIKQGIGELALGGPQLSKGYWRDPERSSERFVWNKRYARYLYMTGDVVRQLHDGSFEFVGRTDDLIKIQGIRIELSEIAFSIRACHPLVEQVEVQYLARDDRPSKVLVAFLAAPRLIENSEPGFCTITDDDGAQVCRDALEKARETLPAYMIPSVFIVANEIPRTSSAKIDRGVLKSAYETLDIGAWERQLASHDKVEATWSSHDTDLLQILAHVSGTSIDAMNRASTLMSIGIDSIRVTRLVSILNNKGFFLSVIDVLQCQTVGDLIALTDSTRTKPLADRYPLHEFHNHWWPKLEAKLKVRDAVVLPTLPIQESLLSETMKNKNAYWTSAVYALNAEIDLERLSEAWLQVAANTEALRVGFIPSAEVSQDHQHVFSSQSTFLQLIYKDPSLDWLVLQEPETELNNRAQQRAYSLAQNSQENYFREPLWAVTVIVEHDMRKMVITIHHSIRDDIALDYILTDVYQAYIRGNGIDEGRCQLQYALEMLLPTSNDIAKAEEFWAKTLHDFAHQEEHSWPDLTGRKAADGKNAIDFISQTIQVASPYEELRAASNKLGASSVASMFRIAWGCILLDYLEAEALVFGETSSDRISFPALQDAIGPLLNVVPVPFKVQGSVREMLAAQSRFLVESRAHQSIHPRFIRKILCHSPDDGPYPALFNYVPEMTELSRDEDTTPWRRMDDLTKLTVEHPVALNVMQKHNGAVELEIVASDRVMSPGHALILAQQVEAMIDTMIRWPDQPARDIASRLPMTLLSKSSVVSSRSVVLAHDQDPTYWVDYFATEHPTWPAAQVVDSLKTPESTSEVWTFRNLYNASNRAAASIVANSHRNEMIAVCLDSRLEAYALVLGILKSGNIYLPIEQSLPKERKAFLLKDSAAVMLFTTSLLAVDFSEINSRCQLVLVDQDNYIADTRGNILAKPIVPLRPEENAYLLYTSGSTGTPKGVLVGRGNLSSFVEGLSEYIYPLIPGMDQLPGKGRYLGLASRAFDVHLAEMFLAWRRGMAVVSAPRSVLLDDLEMALRELRITHASFVPSLIDHAGLDPENLPDLRYLGIGGETISRIAIDTWAPNENVAIVNPYGPTELSIGCCAAEVTPDSNARDVGRPFGNSIAHILVPGTNAYTLRGVSGELCVTGDLVANGYHNRPDAKGFVEDFGGSRMYRTGDIVRLMVDDSVEFIGRKDDQTKIRGQRLELGEISGAIYQYLKTALALQSSDVVTAVMQHADTPKPKLVTFLVPDRVSGVSQSSPEVICSSDATLLGTKVLDHCHGILPAYMIPDALIVLSAIPTAPSSGKADVKMLKALFSSVPLARIMSYSSAGINDRSAKPQRELSQAERVVREAVSQTLGVSELEISIDTNLFKYGLDSLAAISLAIRLQKLRYTCTVADVLKHPILERLALLPRKEDSDGGTMEKIEQARRKLSELDVRFRANLEFRESSLINAVRPCLPLQESIVASSLSDTANPLYVNHVTLGLPKEIDHDRLFAAWEGAVTDHEILRTCFREFENGFVQVVLKPINIHLWHQKEVEDSKLESVNYQTKISKDIVSTMSTKPPLRLVHISSTLPGEQAKLRLSIHHALYDGESLSMLLEEISLRYNSAVLQVQTPVSRLLEYVAAQDIDDSRNFWMDYLADYHSSANIRQVEDQDDYTPMTSRKCLTNKYSEITSLASSLNCTTASIVQTVFGITLAQTLGINDVVFGAVLSGRTVPIENPSTIMAPCMTTIPQRVNFRSHYTKALDLTTTAIEGFVRSLEFQHTALKDIHRWVRADKPLFDCLFSYAIRQKLKHQADVWTVAESSMPAEFPFAVEVEADHEADQLAFNCTFTAAFGSAERAESFLMEMDTQLIALVRGEELSFAHLEMPNGTDRNHTPVLQPAIDSPISAEEERIRLVISKICDINAFEIPIWASFFSLGIDSIIAIRFARMLRQEGLQCSSADVMRNPNVTALAQHIKALQTTQARNIHHDQATPEQTSKFSDPGSHSPGANAYSCTPLQSSMLTQTLGSDGKLYANHHAFRLSSSIDLETLERSWEYVVRETEILRTSFHFSRERSHWEATIHESLATSWTVLSSNAPISESISEVIDRFTFHEDTDFSRAPWQVTLLKRSGETIFILSIHHSLYDGESIKLLFDDLGRVYRSIPKSSRPLFSSAAREIVRASSEAVAYWDKYIDGFKSHESMRNSAREDSVFVEVEATLTMTGGLLLQKCKKLGVTLQTVALLAFGKTLASSLERHDVAFGQLVGGRSLMVPAAEEIVGPLFNTVPFRLAMDNPKKTYTETLDEIQRFSGDSIPHQHASLGRIQQNWRQKPSNTDMRLFDSLFVFQRSSQKDNVESPIMDPLDLGTTAVPTEYSRNLEFEQKDDGVILRMIARDTQAHISEWLAHFQEIFHDILENPRKGVLDFPSSTPSLSSALQGNHRESGVQEEVLSGPDFDCICSVLSEASGKPIDSFGQNTSIFALGLDSIMTIHIASLCRKKGFRVGVADVLQGQTPGGICRRLRARISEPVRSVDAGGPLVNVESRAKALEILRISDDMVEDVLPCLGGQNYHLAMWLNSNRTMCEAIFTYRCSERVQVEMLSVAWNQLRKLHPILRTCFVAVSVSAEEAVQVVLNPSSTLDESLQIREISSDDIREIVKQSTRESFNLFRPPARLTLIQGRDEAYILLKLHHATYDAWTIEVLLHDLASLYQSLDPPPHPPLRPFLEHTVHSLNTDSSQQYWRNHLHLSTPTLLHLPRPSPSSSSPATPRFLTISLPNLRALETRSQTLSLPLPTIILLSFARVLARHTAQPSPTFGLFQTGRSSPFEGVDKICAPLLNILPLCVRDILTDDEGKIRDKVKALQSELGRRVPFEQSGLREVLGEGGRPLFNCYVNVLWHEAQKEGGKQAELFTPYDLGDTADLVLGREQVEEGGMDTAVDGLDTSFLAKENWFLDVGRDGVGDRVNFGVRWEAVDQGEQGWTVNEDALRGFAEEVVSEVGLVIEGMETEKE